MKKHRFVSAIFLGALLLAASIIFLQEAGISNRYDHAHQILRERRSEPGSMESSKCQVPTYQDWTEDTHPVSLSVKFSCDFGTLSQLDDEPEIATCIEWRRQMPWYRYRFDVTGDDKAETGAFAESKCTPRNNAGTIQSPNNFTRAIMTSHPEQREKCTAARTKFFVRFDTMPDLAEMSSETEDYYLLVAWSLYKQIGPDTPLPDFHAIWGHKLSHLDDVRPGAWARVVTDNFGIPEDTPITINFITSHNDRCEDTVRSIRIDSVVTEIAPITPGSAITPKPSSSTWVPAETTQDSSSTSQQPSQTTQEHSIPTQAQTTQLPFDTFGPANTTQQTSETSQNPTTFSTSKQSDAPLETTSTAVEQSSTTRETPYSTQKPDETTHVVTSTTQGSFITVEPSSTTPDPETTFGSIDTTQKPSDSTPEPSITTSKFNSTTTSEPVNTTLSQLGTTTESPDITQDTTTAIQDFTSTTIDATETGHPVTPQETTGATPPNTSSASTWETTADSINSTLEAVVTHSSQSPSETIPHSTTLAQDLTTQKLDATASEFVADTTEESINTTQESDETTLNTAGTTLVGEPTPLPPDSTDTTSDVTGTSQNFVDTTQGTNGTTQTLSPDTSQPANTTLSSSETQEFSLTTGEPVSYTTTAPEQNVTTLNPVESTFVPTESSLGPTDSTRTSTPGTPEPENTTSDLVGTTEELTTVDLSSATWAPDNSTEDTTETPQDSTGTTSYITETSSDQVDTTQAATGTNQTIGAETPQPTETTPDTAGTTLAFNITTADPVTSETQEINITSQNPTVATSELTSNLSEATPGTTEATLGSISTDHGPTAESEKTTMYPTWATEELTTAELPSTTRTSITTTYKPTDLTEESTTATHRPSGATTEMTQESTLITHEFTMIQSPSVTSPEPTTTTSMASTLECLITESISATGEECLPSKVILRSNLTLQLDFSADMRNSSSSTFLVIRRDIITALDNWYRPALPDTTFDIALSSLQEGSVIAVFYVRISDSSLTTEELIYNLTQASMSIQEVEVAGATAEVLNKAEFQLVDQCQLAGDALCRSSFECRFSPEQGVSCVCPSGFYESRAESCILDPCRDGSCGLSVTMIGIIIGGALVGLIILVTFAINTGHIRECFKRKSTSGYTEEHITMSPRPPPLPHVLQYEDDRPESIPPDYSDVSSLDSLDSLNSILFEDQQDPGDQPMVG